MCKVPDYINEALKRLNEFLPDEVSVMPLKKEAKEKIPFGLATAYDFFETEIYGIRLLLVGIGDPEEDLPPSVIAKHRDALRRITDMTPIFVASHMRAYLFPRYAKKNINIIAANKQLFLPAIFLIAGNEMSSTEQKDSKVPNLFQPMVLFNLEREKLDGFTTRDIADKLNVSYATVNRCVRWMKQHGFISMSGVKEKRIEFLFSGRDLWDKALPFLDTPVDFIVSASESVTADTALLSEQNALAEYTMLSGGPHRVAISKKVYEKLNDKGVSWDCFGECGVEVWKYDPKLLSDTGIVDKLSLYLLLKDYEDERVQIELENMMNEIVW